MKENEFRVEELYDLLEKRDEEIKSISLDLLMEESTVRMLKGYAESKEEKNKALEEKVKLLEMIIKEQEVELNRKQDEIDNLEADAEYL